MPSLIYLYTLHRSHLKRTPACVLLILTISIHLLLVNYSYVDHTYMSWQLIKTTD